MIKTVYNKKFARGAISVVTMMAVATSFMGVQIGATISEEKDKLKQFEQQKKDIQDTIDSLETDKAAIEKNIEKLDKELSNISKDL